MTLQQWPQGGGLRGGEAGGWGPEMAGDWVTLGQGASTMGLGDKEARATHRAGTRTTQTSAERTDHCGGGVEGSDFLQDGRGGGTSGPFHSRRPQGRCTFPQQGTSRQSLESRIRAATKAGVQQNHQEARVPRENE